MSVMIGPAERYGTRYPGLAAGVWLDGWAAHLSRQTALACDAPATAPVPKFEEVALYQPAPYRDGRKSRRRIAARQLAVEAGEGRYFTGLPCKHGHIAERVTSSGSCTECLRIRAVATYWKDPQKARDRATSIRKAHPDRQRAACRRWYWRSPERQRLRARNDYYDNHLARQEKSRQWKRANPHHVRGYARWWHWENAERSAASKKRYRIENALTIAEWTTQYRIAHRAEHALSERSRRARKCNAGGFHTIQDVRRLLNEQKRRCVYCPAVLFRFHVDHIMPLALGGSDWPENIQLLCPRCNMRKGAKHPAVFARIMGLAA